MLAVAFLVLEDAACFDRKTHWKRKAKPHRFNKIDGK